MENDVLEIAKKYAQLKLSVIPIKRVKGDSNESKKPAVNKWKSFQNERATIPQLVQWFGNGQPKNLALIGGEVSGNVLWLDFDNAKAYKEWTTEYPEIANTAPTQSTGKGYHVGVRMIPVPGNGKLYYRKRHIGETRGNGGFIIVSPSMHGNGRQYEWIRAPWETNFPVIKSLNDIGLTTEDKTPKPTKPSKVFNKNDKADRIINAEIEKIRKAHNGGRNDQLNKSSFTLGGLVGSGRLTRNEAENRLYNAALDTGLTESETIATIKSGIDADMAKPLEINAPIQVMSSASKLIGYAPHDEGNAQCVFYLHGDKFHYTDEVGWLFYNGKFWTNKGAEAAMNRAVTKTLHDRNYQAFRSGKDAIAKATRLQRANINGCISQLKWLVWDSLDNYDTSPDLLNCNNGIVDLKNGKLSPHSPDMKFSYCVNANYKPEADDAEWNNFVYYSAKPNHLDDDNGEYANLTEFLQMAVGYSLTGHIHEHCMFFLEGPPRGGKGVFLQTLTKLLGSPLSSGVDFDTFIASRGGG